MHRLCNFLLAVVLFGFVSCKNDVKKEITAQFLIDKGIQVSGGELFTQNEVSFRFRKKYYTSKYANGQKILERVTKNDSFFIKDIKIGNILNRYINDSLVKVVDTTAKKYMNSINSVHYFVKLPYGLNDTAVRKKLLGTSKIGEQEYYKIEVTFSENGGGDDFDDTYIYWFNTKTFKPDYLAYSFHVNGGGQRFRVAYNERYINGIRFVDYENYKALDLKVPIDKIDSLYREKSLELLSKIEISDITVSPGSYN